MGRPNKPWYRPDIDWWVTNIGGKQFRIAKGKRNQAEAQRAFHELMALKPQRPEAHDARVCDLAEAFLDFARKKKLFCGHNSELRLLPDEFLPVRRISPSPRDHYLRREQMAHFPKG